MSVNALIASALFAQAAFSMGMDAQSDQKSEVAYEEMQQGQSAQAIQKLKATESNDPGALINLGTAYARSGMTNKAIASYRAAIATDVRYDLQLADGTWMDSRAAARVALQNVLQRNAQAAR